MPLPNPQRGYRVLRYLLIGFCVTLQEVRQGFTWGEVTLVPLLEEEEEDGNASSSFTLPVKPNDRLVIPFQNENLYAYIESADGQKKVGFLLSYVPHVQPSDNVFWA